MKIIKPGNIQIDNFLGNHKCLHCKCIFQIEEGDWPNFVFNNEREAFVCCPYCHNAIKISNVTSTSSNNEYAPQTRT